MKTLNHLIDSMNLLSMKQENTKDLIINFTPTGMVPTKADNPHIPIGVEEIVEDVHAAYEKGITLVHLHARNVKTGEPDYKASIYEKIMSGIKKCCPDLPLCISLSGRNFPEFEKRSEALSLQPDLASLTLNSINFRATASVNSPKMIMSLLEEMNKHGVNPEFEIFDLGMANYLNYLIKKEKVMPPYYINYIFGNIFSMQPSFSHIGAVLQDLPDNSYYSFGGIGKYQLTSHMMAMTSGAGIRVGLEDNLYYDKARKNLATNLQLIDRIHKLAEITERKIMSPSSFGSLGFYNSKVSKANLLSPKQKID